MNKIYVIALLLSVSSVCRAEIVEKPIKLEEPSNQENSEHIVFPPATEPYKPVSVPPKAQVALPQPQAQPSFQAPAPVQPTYQQPSQPAFSSVPVSTFSVGGDVVSTAANCDAELTQLWQQKGQMDSARMAQFQKSMGEAKKRCDYLKQAAEAYKQAEIHLSNYQGHLQQARETCR